MHSEPHWHRDHRLMVRVGRLHHEKGLRQAQIADKLDVSAAKVSRLLKRAEKQGIVRTVVVAPEGLYPELEESLEDRFGLEEVVVVDTAGSTRDVLPALAAAGAEYVRRALTIPAVVGISAWSETLSGVSLNLRPQEGAQARQVVQLIGGSGPTDAQLASIQMLARLANAFGAEPILVPVPGVVASTEGREAMVADPAVAAATAYWGRIDVALLGIGGKDASPTLLRSGNVNDEIVERFDALGAVGDICLRHFDHRGEFLCTEYDSRVIGIAPEQLLRIPRRVGIAGGAEKFAAVRAAVAGGMLTTLITDRATAMELSEG